MKFPTYEEMGQEVANRALDEFEYKGKTIRQWVEIILATDNNVGTKDGTNLAEVGTEAISRRSVIDAVRAALLSWSFMPEWRDNKIIEAVEQLPPIQPDIVRCKDCKYAEYIDDVKTLWCTECGQGRTVAQYDFCSYAEKREVTT